MDNNTQIQHVELSLEEAKKVADLGEAIRRLENNRDFKKVILDCYFTDEARRLVFLTGDTTMSPEAKEGVWADIRGIASLRSFLMNRKVFAEMAQKEIGDHQQTLDELREELAQASE